MIMNTYKDSLPRRFAKAAVLAAGFGTIWAAAVVWLGSTVGEWATGVDRPQLRTLAVAGDGTPLIESYSPNDYSQRTYLELDGRERPEGVGDDQIYPMYLAGEDYGLSSIFGGRPWTSRLKVFRNEREPEAYWYFLQDDSPEGSGYFVGYERVSNRILGYIGLAGSREGPIAPGERIPAASETNVVLSYWSSIPYRDYMQSVLRFQPAPGEVPPRLVHIPSGNLLRVVDLGDRTVRTAFEAPEPIVAVAVPTYAVSRKGSGRSILVRTAGRVYKLDHDYRLVGTFAIPPEVGPGTPIQWYEADDGRAVAFCNLPPPDGKEFVRPSRSHTELR